MERVSYEIEVRAPIEPVFDLISRVEDFSMYSHLIKEIKKVGEKRYRWEVKAFGIPLWWEAEVVEYERPRRFAWRSISGVYNTGSYTLEPSGDGTRVIFEMYYTIPIKFLGGIARHLLSRMILAVYTEVLGNIKKKIEGGGGMSPGLRKI
ncbi:MAG: SRPBCC family protein [Deltaproteobacteria bacterium]|nr:SRPBCC family protein [Deltaproteobacteria bacterium]